MKGAALLISILILGALFLSFAVVGVQGSIRESGSLATLANKKRADSLARACLEKALFSLASSGTYVGNKSLTISGAPCTIRPVLRSGNDWIIETEATVQNQIGRFRAVMTSRSPVDIRSLEPVAQF